MAIGIEEITKIVSDSKKMGHEVKVGDIAYLMLLREISDNKIVYATLFGKDFKDDAITQYEKSAKMKFLRKYINTNHPASSESKRHVKTKSEKQDEISFDENKKALVEKLAELNQAVENGDLEYKDALKAEIDIRTRLNDKFAVSEKADEQMIVVEPKFNHICDYTHKECWLQTKEYAMKHWNLIENNKTEE